MACVLVCVCVLKLELHDSVNQIKVKTSTLAHFNEIGVILQHSNNQKKKKERKKYPSCPFRYLELMSYMLKLKFMDKLGTLNISNSIAQQQKMGSLHIFRIWTVSFVHFYWPMESFLSIKIRDVVR